MEQLEAALLNVEQLPLRRFRMVKNDDAEERPQSVVGPVLAPRR